MGISKVEEGSDRLVRWLVRNCPCINTSEVAKLSELFIENYNLGAQDAIDRITERAKEIIKRSKGEKNE